MDRTPDYIAIELHVIRTERRAQVRPNCSIFRQSEPKSSWVGFLVLFVRMNLTRDPSTLALTSGCPPPFSLILLYVSQHRSLTANGQKKTSSHSFTRDSSNRDREKSSNLTRLFNSWTIGAMNRTLGQSQVKLSLLGSNSLKIDHMLWSRDLRLN